MKRLLGLDLKVRAFFGETSLQDLEAAITDVL